MAPRSGLWYSVAVAVSPFFIPSVIPSDPAVVHNMCKQGSILLPFGKSQNSFPCAKIATLYTFKDEGGGGRGGKGGNKCFVLFLLVGI